MTRQEVYNYIVGQLAVPVTLIEKFLNSFSKVLDFITESAVTDIIPDWTSTLTFNLDGTGSGKYCKHPDTNGKKRLFETKTSLNTNNPPPTDPLITENTHWREISQSSGSSIKEWAAGLFGTGLIIVFHNHSIHGRGLCQLLDPARPFQSTNIETEITAGKWSFIAISKDYVDAAAIQVDTTGSVITLDMLNRVRLAFKGSAVIAGNKSVVITNDTPSEEVKNFRFQTDAAGREFIFESDVKMQNWDGNWTDATKKWISPAAGLFDLAANHINNVWTVRIFGPF